MLLASVVLMGKLSNDYLYLIQNVSFNVPKSLSLSKPFKNHINYLYEHMG